MKSKFLSLLAAVALAAVCASCQLQELSPSTDPSPESLPESRSTTVWHLEDYMKNATSLSTIAGVYWSARDMDSSPIGNHHFITLVYESAAQCTSICSSTGIGYKAYANQKGLTVYYSTIGAFTDDGTMSGKIVETFNQSSDCQAVKEEVNPKKYIYWYLPDYDYEAHRVAVTLCTPTFSTTEAYLRAVIQRAKNFNAHYTAGQTVSYVLYDENCSCMVNSLFNAMGVSAGDREVLGEMSGVDWGEEDLISATYFNPL